MTEIKKFIKGDYSATYCEVWNCNEYFGDVRTEYADKFIDLLNKLIDENKELEEDYEYLKKRFKEEEWHYNHIDEDRDVWRYKCNQFEKENTKLKLQNEKLLYQIGEVGKNNKTCRECECFIPECNICYMWDMEVEADDVVVACDQRKVKKYKGGNK